MLASYVKLFNSKRITNMRNGPYLLIGILIVVVLGMGIYIFREETKPSGVNISIGEKGISVEEK